MEKPARLQRIAQFKNLCRQQGERCTLQRIVILESVLETENHPTPDQIFEAVQSRFPKIARTAVYRTLEHLARMGVITKACHPGRVTRFDPRLDLHHHLVCLSCDEFVDFEDPELNEMDIPDTSNLGFEVIDYRVQIRGICRNCSESGKKEESK